MHKKIFLLSVFICFLSLKSESAFVENSQKFENPCQNPLCLPQDEYDYVQKNHPVLVKHAGKYRTQSVEEIKKTILNSWLARNFIPGYMTTLEKDSKSLHIFNKAIGTKVRSDEYLKSVFYPFANLPDYHTFQTSPDKEKNTYRDNLQPSSDYNKKEAHLKTSTKFLPARIAAMTLSTYNKKISRKINHDFLLGCLGDW